MSTVAEVMAEALVRAGVDVVFGLPGGENVPVVAALRARGIAFVLVHNEASAVYMADATARLRGKPGVCLTTLGPGATNAMAGIGHAFLDRAPVLFITARMDSDLTTKHTHQALDQTALFAPITKATLDLTADNVHQAMATALRLTMEGRPGPVHVQVSKQMALQKAGACGVVADEPATRISKKVAQTDLEKAQRLVESCKRPVVLAGLGLEPERPYDALNALVETIGAGVIVTPKGKGAVSAESPHYIGTIGVTRTDPAYALLAESDCIIAVGFDVVELVRPWDESAPLIWIAPWANQDITIPAVVECVGEMTAVLQRLAKTAPRKRDAWLSRIADHRARHNGRAHPSSSAGRMLPQDVLRALDSNVPANTLVTTDVGSHKILAALDWPSRTPNRYMVSNGLSSMGFGLPAAVAGSIALGRQPVVAIMGDGGFSMVVGELELLTRLQTPVIVVVMNDAALDLIRAAQWRAGEPAYGTEFGNPDFVMIARAYGIEGARVSTPEACATAVRRAVEENRPFLIDALIDPAGYPTTPKNR